MIKKRYLMILSVAIVSVLIGSLFYINITLAPKEQEPTLVDVVNLPVDEQGSLKIALQPTFEVVIGTENQPFSVTVGDDFKLLCEVNVEGWSKVTAYIYWSSKPSIPGMNGFQYRFYYRTSEVPSSMPSSNEYFSFNSGGQVVSLVNTGDVQGPILGIWVIPSGGTVGTMFTANVSVSLYLTR